MSIMNCQFCSEQIDTDYIEMRELDGLELCESCYEYEMEKTDKGDGKVVNYLTFEQLETRDELVRLGFLKIVYGPCEEVSQEQFDYWNEEGIRKEGEPIYVYYNYKSSRKQKFKCCKTMIGDWQFKMFLVTTGLNTNVLCLFDTYPELKDFLCFGEYKYNLRKLKLKMKPILRKEFLKILDGKRIDNLVDEMNKYTKNIMAIYGL